MRFDWLASTRRFVMKLTSSMGMLLLGAWLILVGAMPLLNLSFAGSGTILNVLAIVAGALVLVGK
jgi:hypothetical protein